MKKIVLLIIGSMFLFSCRTQVNQKDVEQYLVKHYGQEIAKAIVSIEKTTIPYIENITYENLKYKGNKHENDLAKASSFIINNYLSHLGNYTYIGNLKYLEENNCCKTQIKEHDAYRVQFEKNGKTYFIGLIMDNTGIITDTWRITTKDSNNINPFQEEYREFSTVFYLEDRIKIENSKEVIEIMYKDLIE